MIKRFLSYLNTIIPKKATKIVIYGRKHLNDNDYSLVKYLLENRYNKKYKIYVVTVEFLLNEHYKDAKNFKIVSNKLLGAFHCLTAKYIFHSYGMGAFRIRFARFQNIISLWHGTSLKNLANDYLMKKYGEKANCINYKIYDSHMLATSDFAKEYFKKSFGYNDDQFIICGYPRCDAMFQKIENNGVLEMGRNYSKTIFFMPTWRGDQFNIKFSLLNESNILDLNKFLESKNVLLVIKPHPVQKDMAFLKKDYSNIKVVFNEQLYKNNLSVYNLLGISDALITDYSSIYFDYLMLDKPIGFVVDDLEVYSEKGGFAYEDPLSYMPGEKIRNIEDFFDFITNVTENNDNYKQERKRICNITNVYSDGENCKRLLEMLEIKSI